MTADQQLKKIALFVCHDLAGLMMLNRLVPAMVNMGLQPVIFNTGTHKNRKFRYPTPPIVSTFNVQLLENVIIPFIDNGGASGGNLSYKNLARKYGAEYHEISDVNDAAFLKEVENDTSIIGGISVRFLQVFKKEIISTFREKGFMWNLHSGLLPKYKGLLTPYRAIANGEKEYGLTLHDVVEQIDEGSILGMAALPLDPRRPVLDLYLDTVDAAAALAMKNLSSVATGIIPQGTLQPAIGRYYYNPTETEFRRYMENGIFYADPDTTLQRIVDAFTPAGSTQNDDLKERVKSFIAGDTDKPEQMTQVRA